MALQTRDAEDILERVCELKTRDGATGKDLRSIKERSKEGEGRSQFPFLDVFKLRRDRDVFKLSGCERRSINRR